MRRRRVLFVSEAVTLAQVVRLLVLARSLPRERYEVHFAAAHFDPLIFAPVTDLHRWLVGSLSPAAVDRRVRLGARIYGDRTLRRYLRDDLTLLDEVRPDLVVGDLRWSLAVAAPLRQIPYAALINAYWSPHAVRAGFPLPDHPIVRLLGARLAARYFPQALPRVFAHFAAPLNRLRRQHGLPEIGSLPQVLCFGDLTLHPDPVALVPTAGAPPQHRHLGPVLWSPAVERPDWWARLDPGRPTVYVTLGSSGRSELLPLVIQAVAELGAQLLVSTAGRSSSTLGPSLPPGVHVAPYLPGDQAARRADVVISNGGSTTSYQALAAGRPVVGLASNLDQYLAMQAITAAGAGVLVRAAGARKDQVKAAVKHALEEGALHRAAATVAADFAHSDAPAAFAQAVEDLAARRSPTA
jgi:UDP:flavonoid glycosyltransferase YjiC (YdhE family)